MVLKQLDRAGIPKIRYRWRVTWSHMVYKSKSSSLVNVSILFYPHTCSELREQHRSITCLAACRYVITGLLSPQMSLILAR